MIELEDDRILLATVDASMRSEIIQKELLQLPFAAAGVLVHAVGASLGMLSIPTLVGFNVALPTSVLTAVAPAAVAMELLEKENSLAAWAEFRRRQARNRERFHC